MKVKERYAGMSKNHRKFALALFLVCFSAVLVLTIYVDFVAGLTMGYGECIVLGNVTYCAPNSTVCPSASCEWVNCSSYVNSNISSIHSVCSGISDDILNWSASIMSLEAVGDYAEVSDKLDACKSNLTERESRLVNLGSCGSQLETTETARDTCVKSKESLDLEITGLNTQLNTGITNMWVALIVGLVAGSAGMYFWKVKKVGASLPTIDFPEGGRK